VNPDRRPTWVIEAGVYGPEAEPLLAEIRRQGMAAEPVPHRALVKGPPPRVGGRPLGPGDRALGYGTFPFARQIQLHAGWVPGAWCDPVRLDCATYYPVLSPFLLNRDHLILPAADAVRRADELFARFGRGGRVFARPTECGKTFVGRCVDREAFAGTLGPVRYDPAAHVVVATQVEVGREWRLLIRGDDVVTATQYAAAGAREVRPGCPAEVAQFAGGVLRAVPWRPDPVFFLDVGESGGRLAVVEVSGFSCSWLYACDLRAVVEAATAAAASV
jgi:hypothetical protein